MVAAARPRPTPRPARAALAVLGIAVLDLIDGEPVWPLPVRGVLDESAHLLTAWLVLTVLTPVRGRLWWWALAGSVLIDLDHIPLVLTGGPVATPGGRPVTHSLITVVVLAVLARAVPAIRIPAAGLALGVMLHFVRDVATGPGIPLLWPWLEADVRVPYWSYLGVLVVVAVAGRFVAEPPPTACARDG